MKLKTKLLVLAVVCVFPVLAGANDAAWDSRFGSPGFSGPVFALKISGGDVYAGGSFTTAGGVNASRIARWNNATWSALGSGVNGDVYAIAVSGSDVYVGGTFTTAGGASANRVAKWNGSSWSALGAGVTGDVLAIAVSGTDVYVGGTFTTAGGTAALRIAKWNGSSWSALGAGPSADVYAIAVSGNDVYVGGTFVTVDGMAASRIAKWNGSAWSPLGSGVSGDVNTIAISGSTVYVGGAFTTAGGAGALRVAKWNGSSWSPLSGGPSAAVTGIAVDGADVYVGGTFTTINGSAVGRIARWNGSSWSDLGSGTSDVVSAVDAAGGDVYVGGNFTVAGTKPSFYFGRFNLAIVSIFISEFEAQVDASGVKLRWDVLADEAVTEFRIYRREGNTAAFAQVNESNPIPFGKRTYTDAGVSPGVSYQYLLGVVRPDGSEVRSPIVAIEIPPVDLDLSQNYPNPFNPSTTIRFSNPTAEHVILNIVDVQGKNVATLVNRTLAAGPQEVMWDGRDARGNAVGSGVYFYVLRVGKTVRTQKMVLVK